MISGFVSRKNRRTVQLHQWRENYRHALASLYEERECDAIFDRVAEEVLQKPKVAFVLQWRESPTSKQADEFVAILEKLKTGTPLQYALGRAFFCDLVLEVNPSVLIPRGETEELVLWALESLRDIQQPHVLDLCTGSGAIALAIAKQRPDATVFACDVSEAALQTAERNKVLCGARVSFFQQDVLQAPLPDAVASQGGFDLIISNPPYVRESEKKFMHPNVLEHEPSLALFVSDDQPLCFYDRIALLAHQHLKPGGCVMVEINEALGNECVALFEKSGFHDVLLREDLHGKPRMLRGRR